MYFFDVSPYIQVFIIRLIAQLIILKLSSLQELRNTNIQRNIFNQNLLRHFKDKIIAGTEKKRVLGSK
jgi:hypothetical protein